MSLSQNTLVALAALAAIIPAVGARAAVPNGAPVANQSAPRPPQPAPLQPAGEPPLSAQQRQAAIAELRSKNLLIPIQGVEPETMKGSYYQRRGNDIHGAVDIPTQRNTPIFAVDDGTIAKLFLSKPGGITIYQYDPSGKYVYYYAHLERYANGLQNKQHVKRGQLIGYVGSSGDAPPNLPHLHFSISLLSAPGKWWVTSSVDPYEVYKGRHPSGPPLQPVPPPSAPGSDVSGHMH